MLGGAVVELPRDRGLLVLTHDNFANLRFAKDEEMD